MLAFNLGYLQPECCLYKYLLGLTEVGYGLSPIIAVGCRCAFLKKLPLQNSPNMYQIAREQLHQGHINIIWLLRWLFTRPWGFFLLGNSYIGTIRARWGQFPSNRFSFLLITGEGMRSMFSSHTNCLLLPSSILLCSQINLFVENQGPAQNLRQSTGRRHWTLPRT